MPQDVPLTKGLGLRRGSSTTGRGRAWTKRGDERRTATRSQLKRSPWRWMNKRHKFALKWRNSLRRKVGPPTGLGHLPNKLRTRPGDFRFPNGRDACLDHPIALLPHCLPVRDEAALAERQPRPGLAAASSDASTRLGILHFTEARTGATSTRRMRGPTFDVRGGLRLAARRPLDEGVRPWASERS